MSFSKELGAKVDVSQVVTDDALISRITCMEDALFKKQAESEFWQQRLAGSDCELWQFLYALQNPDPVSQLQELLGYSSKANVSGKSAESAAIIGLSSKSTY